MRKSFLNKHIRLVIQREYLKVVRKKSFWLSIFAFPALMVIIGVITGLSTRTATESLQESVAKADKILVLDESGLIKEDLLTNALQPVTDYKAAIDQVQQSEADAFIFYPADLSDQASEIEIYLQGQGLLGGTTFNELSQSLLRQSILKDLESEELIRLLEEPPAVQATQYEDGKEISQGIGNFLVPGLSALVFFLMTMTASSYLLMSVSEEKENRVMEIVLSAITPRELIWGKIIGLSLVALTQLAVILGSAIVVILGLQELFTLPFSLSELSLGGIDQILLALYYILIGFLFMASIMVGVGAAMPNYKDAQSFSSFFIIATVMPLYFASAIMADPSGIVAQVTSYLPFTSSLVLIFRSSLEALQWWEILITVPLTMIYTVGAFYLAFRLFELGSLQYTEKLSWSTVRRVLFSSRYSE